MKWSLVFTFFRSLSLSHLDRSLYSLSKQSVKPDEYVFFDNNNGVYSESEITEVIGRHFDVAQWKMHFDKHTGNCRTLSWGNNHAIRLAANDAFILTRADIIYDADFCRQMIALCNGSSNRFATSWVLFAGGYVGEVDYDLLPWKKDLSCLNDAPPESVLLTASHQDTASFMTSKMAMEKAGWYDETLVGWGFDQQDLQTQLMKSGVEMMIAPRTMQYHQFHSLVDGDSRDLQKAMDIWCKSPRRLPDIQAEEKRLEGLKTL